MQMTQLKKLLSFLVCIVLIAALALFTTGCNDSGDSPAPTVSIALTDGSVLGQGEREFTFMVVDSEGRETACQIKTDKKTVGEALMELNLLAGEDGQYGLYVKTVNGITVDYDKDGKYWAFYIDGEYAQAGVDVTEIAAGSTYTFKVE